MNNKQDQAQTITLEQTTHHHHKLPVLRQWMLEEWQKCDPFFSEPPDAPVPGPILAFADGQLAGGLVFSRYASPLDQSRALWINGLIVAPEHQKKGIGRQLIRAADDAARSLSESHMFVYTHLPELYQKCDWEIQTPEKEAHYVLIRRL